MVDSRPSRRSARRRAVWLIPVVVLALVLPLDAACSPAVSPDIDGHSSTPAPTGAVLSTPVSWSEVDAAIEREIAAGPPSLDNIRAVLVSVDGVSKIAHYRRGFAPGDHEHVWSVTKSVLATLIGIAIGDGLIKDLDQPLSALLPEHRKAMTPDAARATLRQLMSMSAGFTPDDPTPQLYEHSYADSGDYVDYLLRRGSLLRPDATFVYSNTSADLVAAVLATALRHADGSHPRTILDYARAKLFDPLGIDTHPAYTQPFALPVSNAFRRAGFAWTTDPEGLALGSRGLRLSAPDMVKIGELYLDRGVWHGRRIVPAAWVEEVTSPSKLSPRYGLLWWIYERDDKVYAAQGAYGQRIVVWPAKHAVVVTLTGTPDTATTDDVDVDRVLVNAVVPAVGEH